MDPTRQINNNAVTDLVSKIQNTLEEVDSMAFTLGDLRKAFDRVSHDRLEKYRVYGSLHPTFAVGNRSF